MHQDREFSDTILVNITEPVSVSVPEGCEDDSSLAKCDLVVRVGGCKYSEDIRRICCKSCFKFRFELH